MSKLLQIDLNHHQARVYYNIYILTSMYFGSGIINLYEQDENELRRICEETLLRKMKLSMKFPRSVMHESKEGLGLVMMKLRMMVVINTLKMYFDNKRYGSEVLKMIEALEEQS